MNVGSDFDPEWRLDKEMIELIERSRVAIESAKEAIRRTRVLIEKSKNIGSFRPSKIHAIGHPSATGFDFNDFDFTTRPSRPGKSRTKKRAWRSKSSPLGTS